VTTKAPLHDIIVTELGGRVGAGVCGSILAQLGATVIVPEGGTGSKTEHRAQLMAGKLSARLDARIASDVELLDRLVARSDVLIVSSDVDGELASYARWLVDTKRVVCNVTAFGDSGPLCGKPYSEAQVQALSGILDTTGIASAAPTPIQLPLLEFMTGIYAAVACQAALRVVRRGDGGQLIDMALYDSAFAAMATFLPKLLSGVGGDVGRLGNRHALAAPWNIYRAEDGWVLVCAVSDDQWHRITGVIGRPELARDPRYLRVADRIQRVDEVDVAVQEWVGRNAIARCLAVLAAAGIPSGPVTPVDCYPHEANLDHRHMIRILRDPVSGRDVFVPASPLRMLATPGISPSSIPAPDADRSEVTRLASQSGAQRPRGSGQARGLPLACVRVIEIGHYTTAPLSARHLANLGADVIKVEPPTGEEMRSWSPAKKGIGYFFAFNNSDKRSLALDLETDEGRATLCDLIARADVLIENLKPGALAKRGFSADELLRLNPRLVYCAVSGFGVDSAYPGRAAFDTVIQAMSGIMDLTRAGEVPVKTGISCADIIGAQMAVAAVLGALDVRDRFGIGQAIDLSMQDCAAWVTMPLWGKSRTAARPIILRANDGFVVVAPPDTECALELPAGAASSPHMTRDELAATLMARGQRAAAVLSAREMLDADQTRARRLVLSRQDGDGEDWALLASPLGLRGTPPRVSRPVAALDSNSAEIRAELRTAPYRTGS
jgi:crotonobetainyl-CoA:carnitine CoA-transferase CaiB-like acyl-CoA transferase